MKARRKERVLSHQEQQLLDMLRLRESSHRSVLKAIRDEVAKQGAKPLKLTATIDIDGIRGSFRISAMDAELRLTGELIAVQEEIRGLS